GRLLRSGLLRRLLRGLLGRRLLHRSLLRGDLLRRHLLGRGLLAEAAARGLAGFLQQLHHLVERQRSRLAILRDLAVELAVAEIGAVTAVEDLDVAALEFLDDPVARDLSLFLG